MRRFIKVIFTLFIVASAATVGTSFVVVGTEVEGATTHVTSSTPLKLNNTLVAAPNIAKNSPSVPNTQSHKIVA